MLKKNITSNYDLVVICWALVCLCTANQPRTFAQGPAETPLTRFDAAIAPSAALVQDRVARDQLLSLLQEFDRTGSAHGAAQLDDSALARLKEFAEKHGTSRAALTANFLIGQALIVRTTLREREAGVPILEAISKGYPVTLEAIISELERLLLSAEAARSNPAERKIRLESAREAIEAALPQLKAMDESADEITIRLRRVLSSQGGKVTPAMISVMGSLSLELGERGRALQLYERVVTEYPGTPDAQYAQRMIESIRGAANNKRGRN